MQLEMIDGTNWQDFVSADVAVLMLGKSDCGACATWTEELSGFLDQAGAGYSGRVRFGKMLLDQRGLTDFKRAHGEWLKDVHDLPFNVIWKGGERFKSWAGGGLERLQNRLAQLVPAG